VLILTYSLNALLMLLLPIALGLFLARRLGTSWSLYGAGALTFVASQVVRLPLLFVLTTLFAQGILPAPPAGWQMAFNLLVLGLSAGLFEEGARYLAYRFWLKNARRWSQGLMFGAGHGGIEAILTGLLVALTLVQMMAFRNADLSALPLPPDQLAVLSDQVAAYWAADWPVTLLGAVERAFALTLHLALSVIVLQAVVRRNLLWLAGAMLWHAAANIAGVYALELWGPYAAEAVIGAFALISLAIIFALRRSTPAPPESPATPGGRPRRDTASTTGSNPGVTPEQLDDSRYA
jgi:uncharacterized membrane protein YhfC